MSSFMHRAWPCCVQSVRWPYLFFLDKPTSEVGKRRSLWNASCCSPAWQVSPAASSTTTTRKRHTPFQARCISPVGNIRAGLQGVQLALLAMYILHCFQAHLAVCIWHSLLCAGALCHLGVACTVEASEAKLLPACAFTIRVVTA
ncbi:hypothetical protein DUNSADRAFT_7621 [Dunaliella salina]|uniref:Encoded protein n=1 Tax=Dunaliella salina TaxID=3046 RepID=A0ABQ7FT65_DUNSA|nr:hypothetical protein DUNSADRAFT_7621 [Dunaliella salina]|eukprot:KAF5825680.1 hypothetical protein DUNSADRAFT_7621 [Dunaliella salina]